MIVTAAPADPLTMLGFTVSSIGAWARDAPGASASASATRGVTKHRREYTRSVRRASDGTRVTDRECGFGHYAARPPSSVSAVIT